jgi:hypothetical protein
VELVFCGLVQAWKVKRGERLAGMSGVDFALAVIGDLMRRVGKTSEGARVEVAGWTLGSDQLWTALLDVARVN